MKTSKEPVYTVNSFTDEEDAKSIRVNLKHTCDTCKHFYGHTVEKTMNILIDYINSVKNKYISDTSLYGICKAGQYTINDMARKYPEMASFFKEWQPLHFLLTRNYASKYVTTYQILDSTELPWWYTHYETESTATGIARLTEPRILFLDWIINILKAYLNENKKTE